MRSDEAARDAETRLAGEHDRLVSMLNTKLVEDACNVVAHRLLRQIERRGDLRVVQTTGDAFEDVALTGGQITEREREAAGCRYGARLGKKRADLGEGVRARHRA